MGEGHVFICYARDDADDVDEVQAALETAEIPVWRDTVELLPGDNWPMKIRLAIEDDARVVIACFSSRGLARPVSYQYAELAMALEQSRLRRPDTPWLIPVRFDDCEVPDFDIGGGHTLSSIQRADLFGAKRPNETARLVETVRRILEQGQLKDADGPSSATVITPKTIGKAIAVGPTVRSDYISQVRRMAPSQLIGRQEELELLSNFCLGEESASYLLLRAGAWAGKSALLSSFVLDPPVGVRVISFFITARLAGQADRKAFAEVVLEQALEIIKEPMPTLLTEATRDAHMLGALARAATACLSRGERLILVVDGLDEDRGVITGPDAHSVAAILPPDPPMGMRVIVAARPDPPIPPDVPDDHPLRHVVAHQLTESPHAQVVRQDAERELKRLLHGSAAEQDMLGLLASAGGGLSGADLAELTGCSSWEIETSLAAVAGRTFTSRAGHWRSETIIYVLGHEELQQRAMQYIGALRLRQYRERLHNWCNAYFRCRWPEDTPEYLMRGYFTILQVDGDVERMLKLATDPGRHDRMLDIIGGDTAALSEITATEEAIASMSTPNLSAMSKLAVHRARLDERNASTPANLPGVWAQLGRVGRAEALARSIPDAYRRVQALTILVHEVKSRGDREKAEILSVHAEHAISAIQDTYRHAQALAMTARAVAEIGDFGRASMLLDRARAGGQALEVNSTRAHVNVTVARAAAAMGDVQLARDTAQSITEWPERAQAHALIAAEVAKFGYFEQALMIAQSISSRGDHVQALSAIAVPMQAAGDSVRAKDTTIQAESVARSIRNPARRSWALAVVADSFAKIGEGSRAAIIADSAEQLLSSIARTSDRDSAMTAIARVRASLGDIGRAELMIRRISRAYRRARAFAAVASGLAVSDQLDKAESMARAAEEIAHTATARSQSGSALAVVSEALASRSDFDRAAKVASAISDLEQRERAFTVITSAAASFGDLDRAEAIAASITDPIQQAKALSLIMNCSATAGDFERAEKVANLVRDETRRDEALTVLSNYRNRGSGDVANAESSSAAEAKVSSASTVTPEIVAEEFSPDQMREPEVIARSISNLYRQARYLMAVSQAALSEGDAERAERSVNCITNTQLRARGQAELAGMVASTGDLIWRDSLIDRAVLTATSIGSPDLRCQVLADIAQRLASAGLIQRSEQIACSLDHPLSRDRALAAVGAGFAESGQIDKALDMVLDISDFSARAAAQARLVKIAIKNSKLDRAEVLARSIADSLERARALSSVALALAESGHAREAEDIALSIGVPNEQARALASLASYVSSCAARRLLARALMIDHWLTVFNQLASIEPDVIDIFADELLRAVGQE